MSGAVVSLADYRQSLPSKPGFADLLNGADPYLNRLDILVLRAWSQYATEDGYFSFLDEKSMAGAVGLKPRQLRYRIKRLLKLGAVYRKRAYSLVDQGPYRLAVPVDEKFGHAEDLFGIVELGIAEPGIKAGQIFAVEQLDHFVWANGLFPFAPFGAGGTRREADQAAKT